MPIIKKQPMWTKSLSDNNLSNAIKTQIIVGGNIYHRRKYNGLSQSELAKKANITQSIVSELETGDYNPSIEMLSKIANALDIKVELLIKENFNWKFLEVLNYFVSKLEKIDILKLMKLTYFSDLESYNKFGYKLTGIKYYRRHAGPFNSEIYSVTKNFKKDEKIFKNISNIEKNIALTKEDEKFLDNITKEYGQLSSIEIRDKSYETKPMEGCKKTNNHKMGELVF